MASSTTRVLNIIEQVLTVLIPVGVVLGKYTGVSPQVAAGMAVLVPLARQLKDLHTEMTEREANKVLPTDKDWAIQDERFKVAAQALQDQIRSMVEEEEPEENSEETPKVISLEHTDILGVSD